jgi:hypothetical protein
MKWLAFALVAILAVATIACGDHLSNAEKTQTAVRAAPAGKQARLRLEVMDPSVTCDGRTHDVRVWLDDLPAEPVRRPTEAPLYPDVVTPEPRTVTPPPPGLSAFEFKLHYDPAVIWVREKSDVQLNPDLDDAPPPSSVPRNFTAAAFIDNYSGYTFAGGIAFGLPADILDFPSDTLPTPLPEPVGIDPVAAGGPILLMTIGLSPVGAGSTELTLDAVTLLADASFEFVPVEVTPASIKVTGDCPKFDTPTPYPSMPSSAAPIPSETPLAPPTPRVLTPVPATSLRSDCPQGWHAFLDLTASLSFCTPAALGAVASVDNIGGSLTTLEVSDPYMYLSLALTPRGNFTREEDVARQCAIGIVPSQLSGEEVHVVVAGLDAVGCHVVGRDPRGGTVEEIDLTAPVQRDGRQLYLNVLAIWLTKEPSAKSLIDQITSTVTLTPAGAGESLPALTSTPDSGGAIHNPVAPTLASAIGRTDCPPDWLGFGDAHFTVCYPPDHYAETLLVPSSTQPYLVIRLIPGAPVAYTPSAMDLQFTATYQPTTICEFEAEEIDTSAQTSLAPYSLAGADGIGCTARTTYAVQFKGSVPAAAGGLAFHAYAVTDAELTLAKAILATVRLKVDQG